MKKDFNISNCIIIKQMILHKPNHYVKYSQYHWKDSFLLYHCFFFYLFCMNLQKLIVSREKEMQGESMNFKSWIERTRNEVSLNELRSDWGGSGSFPSLSVKFTENSSEQIVGRWDNAFRNTHTFIRWKLFFILTRTFKDFEIYTNEIPMKRKFPLFSIP